MSDEYLSKLREKYGVGDGWDQEQLTPIVVRLLSETPPNLFDTLGLVLGKDVAEYMDKKGVDKVRDEPLLDFVGLVSLGQFKPETLNVMVFALKNVWTIPD